jgi:hypothetical protein
MTDGPPRGRILWHELLTTDPEAAIAFYQKVIGWGSTAFATDSSYRLWTMHGVSMGGLMQMPSDAQAPPNWLMYVAVPDVDLAVEQAARLGARTWVPGTDIPNVARFAVLGDPQGATFAVMKPSMPGVGSDDAVAGDFSWHELAAADWKAAWEFYRALFGWEHASSFEMGPMGTYWMFRRGGGTRTLGGMFAKTGKAPAHWLSYVRVLDADRAAALARRHGGKVVNGPMEVPSGARIAMLADPQGAAFAVHTPAAIAVAPNVATPKAGAKAKQMPKPKKKRKVAGKTAKKARRKPGKRTPRTPLTKSASNSRKPAKKRPPREG